MADTPNSPNSANPAQNGENTANSKNPAASPINGQIPPPEHRFSSTNQPKGKGRPKGKSLKTILDAMLDLKAPNALREQVREAFGEGVSEDMTIYEAMALRQIIKALSNADTKAFNAIADRREGKPVQSIMMGLDPADVGSYMTQIADIMKENDDANPKRLETDNPDKPDPAPDTVQE